MRRRANGSRRHDPVLALIRSERGTASRIAEALDLWRTSVWRWPRVPAEYVLTVEQVTGISRHEIRPDLYPPEEPRHGQSRRRKQHL